MIEKIYFDKSTFIWKGKLKLSDYKKSILEESLDVINSSNDSSKKIDAYELSEAVDVFKKYN